MKNPAKHYLQTAILHILEQKAYAATQSVIKTILKSQSLAKFTSESQYNWKCQWNWNEEKKKETETEDMQQEKQ